MSLDIVIDERAYSDIVISDDPFASFYPDPSVPPARGHVYAIVTGLDASVQRIYLGAFTRGQQIVYPITPIANQNVTFAVDAEAADGTREFSRIRDGLKVTALQTINVNDYATNFGDGAATSFTITHNLGTDDLQVEFRYAAGTKESVNGIVWAPDGTDPDNKIVLTTTVVPALNELRVIIKK